MNKSYLFAFSAGIILSFVLGYIFGQHEKLSIKKTANHDEITEPAKEVVTKNKSSDWESLGDPFENLQISNKDTWGTYVNNETGFSIEYPKEFYIQVNQEEITFDFYSPDSPFQKHPGSRLAELRINNEQRTFDEISKEVEQQASEENSSLEVEKFKMNDSRVIKKTLSGGYGGTTAELFIDNNKDVIHLVYTLSNPLSSTFEQMSQTLKLK